MTRHLLVLVICAGCQTAGEVVVDREVGDQLTAVQQHMHARFAATNGARTAIAYGDLERAKQDAQIVAVIDEPGVLPEWKPYLDNVRTTASDLSRSTNLVEASRQLALLGWRCAQCHQAVPKVKSAFPQTRAPSSEPTLATTMTSHQWATARMWEGLIGPSESRWIEGAAALAGAPLTITAEGEVPGHELGIADDVSRIRLLANRARKAPTTFDRAEIYGQLLATCASCHHKIRDR